MYERQEYEAISVAAGPSYNLILGRINLDYDRQKQNPDGRNINANWHFKEPLIMPEDSHLFKNYPKTT